MISNVWLRFFIPLGYLPASHRLSRCSRPRHTPNFTTIRASDGPDSVQHSSFKSLQSRRRGVIHCYIFPLFYHFPRLRPVNIICNKPVTFSLLAYVYIMHCTPYSPAQLSHTPYCLPTQLDPGLESLKFSWPPHHLRVPSVSVSLARQDGHYYCLISSNPQQP